MMERRHLRRAADQALMAPTFFRPLDVPASRPGTAPPFGTREATDDPNPRIENLDTGGHAPVDAITAPIPIASIHDRLDSGPDDVGPDDVPPTAPAPELPASAPIGTWKPNLIEHRRVRVVQPWYRTKAAAAALAAVALAAIVLSTVMVVSRGTEQLTDVTPAASTTASPPPSNARPAPSTVPPAPANNPSVPAPPPPPPPATSESDPPVWRNNDSWTPSAPRPTKKPEIGVTRAPFSATPPPPPAPGKDSSTPGDGRRPHWGPW